MRCYRMVPVCHLGETECNLGRWVRGYLLMKKPRKMMNNYTKICNIDHCVIDFRREHPGADFLSGGWAVKNFVITCGYRRGTER